MTRVLVAAVAAAAVQAAVSAVRPVAQWDVVPYQRISGPFKAGVVAFHDRPFAVEFSVNGKKVAVADKASLNDRTKVEEHWFTLDPAKFDAGALKDRVLRLGAKAVASDGTSHALPDIVLYWDVDGATGSRKEIWLDPKDGIDYSEGTKEKPVKTMKQAVKLCGDGGTVRLARAGAYSVVRIGGGNGRRYWTTIEPGPGLSRGDVHISGGRTGCDKLHLKNATIFSDVAGGHAYALGGVDENSSCWVENCIVRDRGGRAAGRSYTFGNKLVGYVTGGATTEMGDGPRGRLVRNHVLKSLSGDAFSGGDFLAVNCRLVGVDGTGVCDEPAFLRSQGIGGAWVHDVVLSNVAASDCACHGFVGSRLRDSAFSNVAVATAGPERRFRSRYAREMENVLFDRVRVTGQEWEWFRHGDSSENFAPTDVRVANCSFGDPTAK